METIEMNYEKEFELDTYQKYQKHLPELKVVVSSILFELKKEQGEAFERGAGQPIFKFVSDKDVKSVVDDCILKDNVKNGIDSIAGIFSEFSKSEIEDMEMDDINPLDLADDLLFDAQEELVFNVGLLKIS